MSPPPPTSRFNRGACSNRPYTKNSNTYDRRLFSELSRSRFSAAVGFGDGGSDLLIALDGLVLPLVLLPPPPPSSTPPDAFDRPVETLGRRLPLTLVLPPALAPTPPPVGAPPLVPVALVPRARTLAPVRDVRLLVAPPRTTPVLGFTPDRGGGLAVEEDDDSRGARRPPVAAVDVLLPPVATDDFPPPPPALVRPNPKLPPWLLRGLGGAVDALLPDARVTRVRGGLFEPRAPLPPLLRREEVEEEDGPVGLLRLSWRVALPSCTWLTWLAKRRLQTVSLAEAAVGERLTNMSALPSPERQSCGSGGGSGDGGGKRRQKKVTREKQSSGWAWSGVEQWSSRTEVLGRGGNRAATVRKKTKIGGRKCVVEAGN